jgi:hypothetical protein
LTGWLRERGYSVWDYFLLKYGGEVFLERKGIFCMINIKDILKNSVLFFF